MGGTSILHRGTADKVLLISKGDTREEARVRYWRWNVEEKLKVSVYPLFLSPIVAVKISIKRNMCQHLSMTHWKPCDEACVSLIPKTSPLPLIGSRRWSEHARHMLNAQAHFEQHKGTTKKANMSPQCSICSHGYLHKAQDTYMSIVC